MHCDKYFIHWKLSQQSLFSNRGETALECIQIVWYQDMRMQHLNWVLKRVHNVRLLFFSFLFLLLIFFSFVKIQILVLVLSIFDYVVQIFFVVVVNIKVLEFFDRPGVAELSYKQPRDLFINSLSQPFPKLKGVVPLIADPPPLKLHQ